MSSWTTDPYQAYGQFGEGGITFYAEVPVEQVLSTPRTGFGALGESEIVLIGRTTHAAHAWSQDIWDGEGRANLKLVRDAFRASTKGEPSFPTNIDDTDERADWLRAVAWDLPTDPAEFRAFIGDRLDHFMALPAARAMPPALRVALGNGSKAFNRLEPRDARGWWTTTPGVSVGAVSRLVTKARAGGFTYDPISGFAPTSGFAVSPFPDRETAIPASELKAQHLLDFASRNADLLAKPGYFIGGWRDGDVVYVDVTVVADDDHEAARIGEEFDQQAFFNLSTGEVVDVRPGAAAARHEADPGAGAPGSDAGAGPGDGRGPPAVKAFNPHELRDPHTGEWMKVGDVAASTYDEAVAWVSGTQGGIRFTRHRDDEWALTDAHREEVAATINEVHDRLPGMRRPSVYVDNSTDAFAYAGGWPSASISIGRIWADPEDIAKFSKEWDGLAIGGGRDEAGTKRAVLVHEAGHNVMRQIEHASPEGHKEITDLVEGPVSNRELGLTLIPEYADKINPRWLMDALIWVDENGKRHVDSTYATENTREWFAEAFADGFLNGEAASPQGKRALAIAIKYLGSEHATDQGSAGTGGEGAPTPGRQTGVKAFNPHEARDGHGRWTRTGGGISRAVGVLTHVPQQGFAGAWPESAPARVPLSPEVARTTLEQRNELNAAQVSHIIEFHDTYDVNGVTVAVEKGKGAPSASNLAAMLDEVANLQKDNPLPDKGMMVMYSRAPFNAFIGDEKEAASTKGFTAPLARLMVIHPRDISSMEWFENTELVADGQTRPHFMDVAADVDPPVRYIVAHEWGHAVGVRYPKGKEPDTRRRMIVVGEAMGKIAVKEGLRSNDAVRAHFASLFSLYAGQDLQETYAEMFAEYWFGGTNTFAEDLAAREHWKSMWRDEPGAKAFNPAQLRDRFGRWTRTRVDFAMSTGAVLDKPAAQGTSAGVAPGRLDKSAALLRLIDSQRNNLPPITAVMVEAHHDIYEVGGITVAVQKRSATTKQVKTFLDQVALLQKTNPLPDEGMIVYYSDEPFKALNLSQVAAGEEPLGFTDQLTRKIVVKPVKDPDLGNWLMQSEDLGTGLGPFMMPSAESVWPPSTYYLRHEWGHAISRSTIPLRHENRSVPDALAAAAEATGKHPSVLERRFVSQYGRRTNGETYAELFAAFMSGANPLDNPLLYALGKAEDWKRQ